MSDCRGFNYRDSRPNWESIAEKELAYLVSTTEVTLPKAYGFFSFLQGLLPRGFDWLTHCEYGIDVDSGAPGELKVIFNFPGSDEHILIKTFTDGYSYGFKLIVRDKFSNILISTQDYQQQPSIMMSSYFRYLYRDYQHAQRKNS